MPQLIYKIQGMGQMIFKFPYFDPWILGQVLSSSPETCQRWGDACFSGQSGWGSEGDWRTLWAACRLFCWQLLRASAELKRVGLESSLFWHTAIQKSGSPGHVTTCSSIFYPPVLRHARPMTRSTVELCESGRPFSGIKGKPSCGCCGDWCAL